MAAGLREGHIMQHRFDSLPFRLTIEQAAEALGVSSNSIYIQRSRHQFPVRVITVGRRAYILLSDLVRYLEDGRSQISASAPICRYVTHPTVAAGRGRGRPTKAEQLAAEALGVTVREYRARGVK